MDWTFRKDLPIYTQLVDKLSAAIVSGIFSPGEKFPSVRDLAMEAGVNPNTAQRAMADLERAGLIYSQRTSGRFVTEDRELIKKTRRNMAEEKIGEFFEAMKKIGYDEADTISLIDEKKGV